MGTAINPNTVYRNVNAILDAAGIDPGVKVHSLRHTRATHLLFAHVPLELVSRRLGHSKTSITLDFYSHALPGMEAEVLKAIEKTLCATEGSEPDINDQSQSPAA